jgi:hypothetical protein
LKKLETGCGRFCGNILYLGTGNHFGVAVSLHKFVWLPPRTILPNPLYHSLTFPLISYIPRVLGFFALRAVSNIIRTLSVLLIPATEASKYRDGYLQMERLHSRRLRGYFDITQYKSSVFASGNVLIVSQNALAAEFIRATLPTAEFCA